MAVRVGKIEIDLSAKTATTPDGDRVHLTRTEWDLLELLIRQPGKLLTSRMRLTALRGAPEHTDPSYLRIYMTQLRRKLEPDPAPAPATTLHHRTWDRLPIPAMIKGTST